MNRIKLIIIWLWVGVPLGWGVYQSVKKSVPLFTSASVPAATTPAAK